MAEPERRLPRWVLWCSIAGVALMALLSLVLGVLLTAEVELSPGAADFPPRERFEELASRGTRALEPAEVKKASMPFLILGTGAPYAEPQGFTWSEETWDPGTDTLTLEQVVVTSVGPAGPTGVIRLEEMRLRYPRPGDPPDQVELHGIRITPNRMEWWERWLTVVVR